MFGARYGDRTLAVIAPWPHYAHLEFGERVTMSFRMPARRHDAAPCALVAQWTDADPLAIARVFRRWREAGEHLGVVPKRVPLAEKIRTRPEVGKPAPAFRLNDHTGRAVSPLVQEEDAALWTVLAFYPKAMTPG